MGWFLRLIEELAIECRVGHPVAIWQAPWQAQTTVSDDGWTAEVAIPWGALRYSADTTRIRANFYRIARRDNELSGWVAWPRSQTFERRDNRRRRRRRRRAPLATDADDHRRRYGQY